jgi:uncharacterized membrane protein YbhN (UPF0104 family)
METPKLKNRRGRLVVIGLLALAVYVVLPQFADFHSSWQVLRHIDLWPAGLAVIFTALTYLAAGATYWVLAFKRLPYWRTAGVQLAAMFVNRLLPAGLGAVGTNYAYLRHMKHTRNQAISVVTANNLAGAAGHALLVALVLLTAADQAKFVSGVHLNGSAVKLGAAAAAGLLLVLAITARRKWRHKLADMAKQLLSYRRRPARLLAALLTSMTLTMCNVLCLWAAATAAGLHLPLAALFIIFTFGVSLGTATPTPGGLGGFEAGLFAGLVAYGVAAGPALAVALLYRLVSYWLVLVIGAAAFAVGQRQGLFAAKA